jgi:prevent-host-death family protein
MIEFTLSDLNRRPGEIVEAALAGPVCLTRHGRRKLVILQMDRYEDLLKLGETVEVEQPRLPNRSGLAGLNSLGSSNEDWHDE